MFDRMAQVIRDGAGWVYSDAFDHPRVHYQPGSIRDNFDFGPVIGISVKAARDAGFGDWKWGGLYDLRLRISETYPVIRIPEPLYAASVADSRPTGQKVLQKTPLILQQSMQVGQLFGQKAAEFGQVIVRKDSVGDAIIGDPANGIDQGGMGEFVDEETNLKLGKVLRRSRWAL